MNRKIYLGIIYFIAIIAIIIGISIHFLDNSFSIDFGFGNSGKRVEKTETLSAFEDINLDMSVMSVTLKTGSDYEISYKCPEKAVPTYEIKNNTLYVTQSTKLQQANNCKMTITIPEDLISSVTASIDVGTFETKNMHFKGLDVFTDVGDVEITNSTSASSDIATDVGDIDLVQFDCKNISVTADVGDVNLESCEFENLDISSDIGDIDVTKTLGNAEDYSFDIETDLGDVDVNGQDCKREYSKTGNTENSIIIHGSTGDVDVDFQ